MENPQVTIHTSCRQTICRNGGGPTPLATRSSGSGRSINHSSPKALHWADMQVTQEEELALLEVGMDSTSCETLQLSTGIRQQILKGGSGVFRGCGLRMTLCTHNLSNNPNPKTSMAWIQPGRAQPMVVKVLWFIFPHVQ